MPKHKKKGPLSLLGAKQVRALPLLRHPPAHLHLPHTSQHSPVRHPMLPAAQAAAASPAAAVRLRVVLRDSAAAGRGLPAFVHPSSLAAWLGSGQQVQRAQQQALLAGALFCLQLAGGSDCVLHARVNDAVAAGAIQVDEVQAANLRLCQGEDVSLR